MLRHQVEDMEKAKQDMVRDYEQQLKKFQEEVSCKKRRLAFSFLLICCLVDEILRVIALV